MAQTEYEKVVNDARSRVITGFKEFSAAQEQVIAAAKEAQAAAAENFPPLPRVVENSYKFAAELMELQKSITLRWMDLFTPDAVKPTNGTQ
jgi:hypothetical protein